MQRYTCITLLHVVRIYNHVIIIGAEDCLKPVDTDVWLQVSVEKSQPTPPFYCEEFSDWADTVYQHMGLSHRNVTSANCREVYIKLVQYLNVCDLI